MPTGIRIDKADFKRVLGKANKLRDMSKRTFKKELREAAESVASDMRINAPVSTGRLRDSIEVTGVGTGVEILVDVPYGGAVEFGTRFTRAQPFFFKHTKRLSKMILDKLSKKIHETILK